VGLRVSQFSFEGVVEDGGEEGVEFGDNAAVGL
jgi:hypothetical protein